MDRTRPKKSTSYGETVTHFDLDALEAEAQDEPFTFTLAGEVFTMLSPEEVDWRVADNLSNGDGIQHFVSDLLGDDFKRFAKHKVSSRQLAALIEACTTHYGITPGESRASGGSSRSTRRR
jgi:hypothetical protein